MLSIDLPWQIRNVPRAVPRGLALLFLGLSVAKLAAGPPACFSRWRAANEVMGPLELALAALLWTRKWRTFGALLSCGSMLGAAALLTWAHMTGLDVKGCGCFGPIKLPYWVHMLVAGVLFAYSFLVLISVEKSYDVPNSLLPERRRPLGPGQIGVK